MCRLVLSVCILLLAAPEAFGDAAKVAKSTQQNCAATAGPIVVGKKQGIEQPRLLPSPRIPRATSSRVELAASKPVRSSYRWPLYTATGLTAAALGFSFYSATRIQRAEDDKIAAYSALSQETLSFLDQDVNLNTGRIDDVCAPARAHEDDVNLADVNSACRSGNRWEAINRGAFVATGIGVLATGVLLTLFLRAEEDKVHLQPAVGPDGASARLSISF
jgi:hypothetical protein